MQNQNTLDTRSYFSLSEEEKNFLYIRTFQAALRKEHERQQASQEYNKQRFERIKRHAKKGLVDGKE